MRYSRACTYTIFVLASAHVWGQTPASGNAIDQQKLSDAASQGFKMQTSPPAAQVKVEAVLLPAAICKRVFGKEVADKYAAIELTVANKNSDADFLIHGVYLDYDGWLLSGSPAAMSKASGNPMAQNATPNMPNTTGSTQYVPASGTTQPNQVASVEYRIVRGEAVDAQMWTSRNWTMRALQLVGVIATGSEFAFKEKGIAKAIGAFTGQGIPAANAFWPDGTTPQIDRISDFGYRTNKVIPRGSADILVAFFPIDRFLTPGLKAVFLKSPAVFFAPAAVLADTKVDKAVKDILAKLGVTDLNSVLTDQKAQNVLYGISLNRVHVVVGGAMAVDPDTIPARLDSVTFDGTPDWTKAGTITGVLNGALLTNGQVTVAGATLNPQPVSNGSNDVTLHFSLTVPSTGVGPCTNLTLTVSKAKDGKTSTSNPVTYTVPGQNNAACPSKQ